MLLTNKFQIVLCLLEGRSSEPPTIYHHIQYHFRCHQLLLLLLPNLLSPALSMLRHPFLYHFHLLTGEKMGHHYIPNIR